MNFREAKVLLAVAAHIDGRSDKASIGLTRLVDETGMSKRSFYRAIAGLKDRGVLGVHHGGGKPGHTNTYEVLEPGDNGDAKGDTQGGSISNPAKLQKVPPKVAGIQTQKVPKRAAKGATPIAAPLSDRPKGLDQSTLSTEYAAAPHQPEKKPKQNQPKKNGSQRTRASPLWDAVCEAFKLEPCTKADRSRVGRIVRDLGLKGGTPDEIKKRVERHRAAWPKCECTPESLLKHWERFGADAAGRQLGRLGRVEAKAGKYERYRTA
ncbi:MAG: hypothetical protein WBE26_06180 [Phycisphaerae bacterium]